MKRRAFLTGGATYGAALLTTGVSAAAADDERKAANGVRHLGQPCRARNIHAGVLVEDAGREWFVITNTNENANVELIFIDAKTDTGHVYRAPAGSGAWALKKLPGNRLAIGTYYDGMFLIFDVPTRKWVRQVKFPGEDYIWQVALGSDGRLYGGTYPGGRLGALDVDTGAFEDLGAPTPENKYLRWTTSLPDGRIHCNLQFERPQSLIFDPETKQFTPAPEHFNAVTKGAIWNGYYLHGNKAYRMPDLAVSDPLPFPAPPADAGAWAVDINLTDEKTLVLRQGTDFYEYRVGDPGLTKTVRLRARGSGGLFARNAGGQCYGIRGQDYFVISPAKPKQELRRIPGEAAPRGTHFLYADDQGRLWGGPTFGQTLFYMDIKTGKTVNTGVVSDDGGEVYGVEVLDGVCYAVAYAGGEVIRFDPAEPWNQLNHVNPKTIARVGPDYIRPQAGVRVGPEGRLYSGWLAKYGEYGGLLLITDPKTGKSEQVNDPLGPHGLSGVQPVGDGLVLLGSTIYGNGLGVQKDTPSRLGLFDLNAKKLVYSHDFPGSASLGSFVFDPATGIAAFTAVGGKLYLFDVNWRAFVGGANDGPAIEGLTGYNIVMLPGKSRVVYAIGDTLHARGLRTGATATLATLPAKIESISAAPDGAALYAACGVDVYEARLG